MEATLYLESKTYISPLVAEAEDLLTFRHLSDEQIKRLTEIFDTLVFRYAELTALPHFTESEADEMQEILTLAENDEILSNWLTEFDHAAGHALGHLDVIHRKAYKDYYALLKERCCHTTQLECEGYLANCNFLAAHLQGPVIRKMVEELEPKPESESERDPVSC